MAADTVLGPAPASDPAASASDPASPRPRLVRPLVPTARLPDGTLVITLPDGTRKCFPQPPPPDATGSEEAVVCTGAAAAALAAADEASSAAAAAEEPSAARAAPAAAAASAGEQEHPPAASPQRLLPHRDWTCEQCGFENWGRKQRTSCFSCGAARDMHELERTLRELLVKARSQQIAFAAGVGDPLPPSPAPSSATTTPRADTAAAVAAAAAAASVAGSRPTPPRAKRPRLPIGGSSPADRPPVAPAPAPSRRGPPLGLGPPPRLRRALPPLYGCTPAPTLDSTDSLSTPDRCPFVQSQLRTPRQYRGATVQEWDTNLSRVRSQQSGKRAKKLQRSIDRVSQVSLSDLRWDTKDPIGNGAYGQVMRCWIAKDEIAAAASGRSFPGKSDLMALKQIDLDDGDNETFLRNRLTVGHELQSWDAIWRAAAKGRRGSYLVQPLRPFDDAGCFFMLQEFMHFGSLDDLVQVWTGIPSDAASEMSRNCVRGDMAGLFDSPSTPTEIVAALPVPAVSYIMRSVLRGLEFLHTLQSPMCHLDVKPGNILIDNWGQVKLGDFGLMSFIKDDVDGGGGTRTHMAPERVRGKEACMPASDIWSLGVTATEVALGLHSDSHIHLFSRAARSSWIAGRQFDVFLTPSSDDGAERRLHEVLSWDSVHDTILAHDQLRLRWMQVGEDSAMIDFCRNCLAFLPVERPAATDLLHHQFIAQGESFSLRDMKRFLDSLVDNVQVRDKLSGRPPRWQKRGWEMASDGRHGSDDLSSTLYSGCASTGGAQSQRSAGSSLRGSEAGRRSRRRRCWRGQWRGHRARRGAGGHPSNGVPSGMSSTDVDWSAGASGPQPADSPKPGRSVHFNPEPAAVQPSATTDEW
eukprot:TRINITY_DN551_c0_g1_i2.p1 TRINITY_DN551_c0_g1~~TRINITY_DN551_c0_g1_i2.p1  ORF type:complete len:865 (+),score=245.50 TRINITY_DN551_c0_g1_i2:255-2849(+)